MEILGLFYVSRVKIELILSGLLFVLRNKIEGQFLALIGFWGSFWLLQIYGLKETNLLAFGFYTECPKHY